MFQKARLRLTVWYVGIIMLVSILFSVAFYHVSTREIQRIINRIEFRQQFPEMPIPPRLPEPRGEPTALSLEELQESKKQLLINLAALNLGLFMVAGVSGYFLAGRTLKPIKDMLDEQNQFISNASHELRTPISVLRAELEAALLERNVTSTQAKHLIKSNLEEVIVLQNLTDRLLNLSIHESFNNSAKESVALSNIIRDAEKKVHPLASQKHITIYKKIKPIEVIVDKQSLIEAFVILLDNAIKYSPPKKTITITTKTNREVVKIYIKDNGVGISKNDLPHIFERFYRADKSRSKTEGYGLGLPIAQKIVVNHEGSLTVDKTGKEGTTFLLQLPLSS